ncbi:hypothetical protein HHI36_015076, partial [Cryptolaemus montrouzieri]
ELDRRVYEHSNTKVEIKRVASTLKRTVEILERLSTKERLDKWKYIEVEISKYDVDTEVEPEDSCVATQTSDSDVNILEILEEIIDIDTFKTKE